MDEGRVGMKRARGLEMQKTACPRLLGRGRELLVPTMTGVQESNCSTNSLASSVPKGLSQERLKQNAQTSVWKVAVCATRSWLGSMQGRKGRRSDIGGDL